MVPQAAEQTGSIKVYIVPWPGGQRTPKPHSIHALASVMPPTGWVSCRAALSVTALSSINFLDSYCRYLISVSLLPYLNYASYEYGLLSGAVFGVVCAAVGVAMSLHPFVTKHAVAALSVATILFSGAFMCTALTSSFAQVSPSACPSLLTPPNSFSSNYTPPNSAGAYPCRHGSRSGRGVAVRHEHSERAIPFGEPRRCVRSLQPVRVRVFCGRAVVGDIHV